MKTAKLFPARKKTLLCLLLCLSLLPYPRAEAQRYPDKVHLTVDYADMLPVTAFDETALQAALEELEGLCGRHSRRGTDRQTLQRLQTLCGQILEELNVLITKLSLSRVQYDAGGGAVEDAALYQTLSAQQTRLFDRCYQVFGKLAASPYRDVLEDSAGEGTAQSLLGYQGLTEEESALFEEEERLVQEYDRIISKGVPVLAEGRTWTAAALESAEVDNETYQAVRPLLERERNRAAGELYRRLLQLRTGIAAQAGFDSYADYAYWFLYGRDYELEDIAPLREAAKGRILPLQLRLLEEIDERELRALDIRSRKSGEEILDGIRPFLHDFDGRMGDAFDFMREHHLYDIEYGEDKFPTSYTVALPAYGSAIIFAAPYGDYRDYGCLVHEFGHFNETFYSTQHDLWSDFNIDVGEIDSQALELLFTGYAGELFGERYGAVYTKVALCNILDSILDGCLYDEFQEAAYANPDMSVEELNRLFKRLSEEYGYSYDPGVEEDSTWVETSHNFQNPMYFISYATSALSALDLWFLYLDSPRQAKEVYLDLSALSLSLPYREATAKVGLRDIFDPEVIPELAETLEAYLDGKDLPRAGNRIFSTVMVWIAVVWIVLCLLLMVRAVKILSQYGKRRQEWEASRTSKQNGEKPRWGDGPDPWSRREKKPPWEL